MAAMAKVDLVKMMDITQRQFLALVRSGLWGGMPEPNLFKGNVDWAVLIELAKQQTVVGLLTDVVVKLPENLKPPKPLYFSLVMMTGKIEQENKRMNGFAEFLQGKLAMQGVHTLLLKGQGVAQCYRSPLYRQSGDIDLFIIDKEQYRVAKKYLAGFAKDYGELPGRLHSEYEVNNFLVELHGDFHFVVCQKCVRHLRQWQEKRLQAGGRSLVLCTGETIVVPSIAFDALFIFGHMLQHYMEGGVGLRQIADWVMFLYHNYEKIDVNQLIGDLHSLGLIRFWRYFAALAVDVLGCPAQYMPLYEPCLHEPVKLLLDSILKTGNFGMLQKEKQLSADRNKFLKKIHTAFGQLPVYWRTGKLFPAASIYCFWMYTKGVAKELLGIH